MNCEYKSPITKLAALSFSGRYKLHLALSLVALLCLSLALIPHTPKISQVETLELAADMDVAESTTNPVGATKAIAALTKQTTDTLKPIISSKTFSVKAGDTLAKIFTKLGYATKDIPEILAAHEDAKKYFSALKPNQTLTIKTRQDKQLESLTLQVGPGHTLALTRTDKGFSIDQKQIPLEKQLTFGKGQIKDSLFLAGKRAGLDHNIISQLVDIFGWNIDFALDLKPDDSFRVLFEEKRLEGERIETGPILAAELINKGKKHQAIRYTDTAGKSGYFSPDGFGMQQSFLRTPVKFSRISSKFGSRKHPVLNRIKKHTGVDYAAPTGTPVHATGDGKVIFKSRKGGYGNVVELQHGREYSTVYAHLSKFGKINVGSTVKQGDIIGYVGKTGLATGPHLHYEFKVKGAHKDPISVVLPRKNPISGPQKDHFLAHAKEMLRLMDKHEDKIRMAQNVIEPTKAK